MGAICTSVPDELKDEVYATAKERGETISKFVGQALIHYLERIKQMTYNVITGDLIVVEDEADELNQDELYQAQMAFYDAYTNGSHAAWVYESERLAQAIERRYNLAKVRCSKCGREECSH